MTDKPKNPISAPDSSSYIMIISPSGSINYLRATYYASGSGVVTSVDIAPGEINISVDNSVPSAPKISFTLTPVLTSAQTGNAATFMLVDKDGIAAGGTDANVPVVIASKGTQPIYFNVNGGTRWYFTEAMLSPNLTNTQDIGSNTFRVKDIYAHAFYPLLGNADVVAGAVTIDRTAGTINAGTLSTLAGGTEIITFNNSYILDGNTPIICTLSYSGAIGADGVPYLVKTSQVAGAVTLLIHNAGLTALNGDVTISFRIN